MKKKNVLPLSTYRGKSGRREIRKRKNRKLDFYFYFFIFLFFF
jgi:hypothetical protein